MSAEKEDQPMKGDELAGAISTEDSQTIEQIESEICDRLRSLDLS